MFRIQVKGFVILAITLILYMNTVYGYFQVPQDMRTHFSFDGNPDWTGTWGQSGSGINLGAQLTTDRFGNSDCAYYFNGSSLILANDVQQEGSSTFFPGNISLALWVYYDEDASGYLIDGQSGSHKPYRIEITPDGGLLFGLGYFEQSSQSTYLNYASTQLTAYENSWIQILCTYSQADGMAKIYINGDLQSYAYLPYNDFVGNLCIGGSNSSYNGWLGKIDDLRIYDRALSETEIQSFFPDTTFQGGGSAGMRPGLCGDYDGDGVIDELMLGGDTGWDVRNIALPGVYLGLQLHSYDYNIPPFWADFDNDGDLDIFCGGSSDGIQVTNVYENTGNDTFVLNQTIPGVSSTKCIGDYDLDGDFDLITNSWSGAVLYYNQNGTFVMDHLIDDSGGYGQAGFNDFNCDAYLDIYVVNVFDSSFVIEVNGVYVLSIPYTLNQFSPQYSIDWGDYNFDNVQDVIFGLGSQTLVYSSEGGSGLQIINTGIGYADYVYWLDGNGDGKLDVFTGDVLYGNTLAIPNLPPSTPYLIRYETLFDNGVEYYSFQFAAIDDHTQSPTYNLRIGTSPGANDIKPSMSNSDGVRLVSGHGESRTIWRIKASTLNAHPLWWFSCQALDASMLASPFSTDLAHYNEIPVPIQCEFPLNQSVELPLDIAFSWNGSIIPASYSFSLGTDYPPSNEVNGHTSVETAFSLPSHLLPNTTYNWQVIPYNTSGPAANCPIWSFTTRSLSVDFSVDITAGILPVTVHFTDLTSGSPLTWQWDFNNDGSIDSSVQHPIYTYTEPGTYAVTLIVSDNMYTESITKNGLITIHSPVTNFSVDLTSGTVPLTVHFTDNSSGIALSWAWDFNSDGQIDSTEQNPVWTFIMPGEFDVSLTVLYPLVSDIEVKANLITATLNQSITRYVPDQYQTIQAAIDASTTGDYIIVADGTYYENLLIEGKNITLGSWYFIDGDTLHIANTIIDGGNALNPDQASTITILPGTGRPVISPHVIGFTIRNGSGRRILQNIGGNIIEKRVGGGIYIRQANPIFTYNNIEDNDADDEGGGSYAFQSIPNLGGMENAAIGRHNPGGNRFLNNHADVGADFYVYGDTARDVIQLQNCEFEVFSQTEGTVSNYWVNASTTLNFSGCSGQEEAISTDIYVAPNGNDTNNSGISPDSPFQTIDHALSRILATSLNPLTIHLAAGTYSPSLTGESFPLQMVEYVSLQGTGRNETFLDAEANVDFPKRVLNLDNIEGVQISNLTLMGGFVTLTKNYNGGGIGVINSSLDLHDVLLSSNSSAGDGAGIYAYQSILSVEDIQIEYNAALGSGGAIYSKDSSLLLSGSSINNNSVNRNGAGIFADTGTTAVENCIIEANQATGSQSKGGGICITSTDSASLRANRISGNNADNGAAIFLQNNMNISLDRNLISRNTADFQGGGIFVNTSSGQFTNNLIAHNTATQNGGGIYCQSSPLLINNTIAANQAMVQGGGLYLHSGNPSHQNTIYWGNSAGANPNQVFLYTEEADPDFDYCDVQGGSAAFTSLPGLTYTGVYSNCIDADPLFLAPASGPGAAVTFSENAYSLQDSSPCIDTGYPGFDPALTPLDLPGNPRVDNNRIDIGAFEAIHYNGPRIVADPVSLDFGRVNINGTVIQETISISNNGNQALLVSDINLEEPGTEFSWTFADLNTSIQPGASVSLQISFLPQQTGAASNIISLDNNSLNIPLLSIPLSGYGIDASSSQPSNLQLQIIDNDVHLSWDPVLSDPLGNPFTPEGYIVLYSETTNASLDDYLYLTFSTDTSAVHTAVARFQDSMFYRVIAVDGSARSVLENLLSRAQRDHRLSWQEIRELLSTSGTSEKYTSTVPTQEW